nr:hypothetical protein [Amylibacter sp.]
MSAPETNIEKQTKRHFGPLMGMTSVVLAAVVVMLALTYMSDDVSEQDAPITQPAESSVESAPVQSN